MKTREQIIEAELKAYRSSLKLHVVDHMYLPNAVNSFMIFGGTEAKPTGFICCGNARMYVPASDMTKLCYPTVFKSHAEAKRHMEIDYWANRCIDCLVDILEFDLRAA